MDAGFLAFRAIFGYASSEFPNTFPYYFIHFIYNQMKILWSSFDYGCRFS